jgi:hypothetical protein
MRPGEERAWLLLLRLVVAVAAAGFAGAVNASEEPIFSGNNATTAARRLIRVNVTLDGLSLNQSLGLPISWGASMWWQKFFASTGECPAGRYCPAGAGAPRMCRAGAYSSQVKRKTDCPIGNICEPGSYCPDPGVKRLCPAHTTSKGGSTSLLDCTCEGGFECVYKKQVSLNMVLHVPLGVWLSESGKLMQQKLMEAVAESAGVGVNDVKIDQALPYMSTGGASRRLLGAGSKGDALLLRFTLHGAEKVGEDALQAKVAEILPGKNENNMRRIRFQNNNNNKNHAPKRFANVHWARADRVYVKPTRADRVYVKPNNNNNFWAPRSQQ